MHLFPKKNKSSFLSEKNVNKQRRTYFFLFLQGLQQQYLKTDHLHQAQVLYFVSIPVMIFVYIFLAFQAFALLEDIRSFANLFFISVLL